MSSRFRWIWFRNKVSFWKNQFSQRIVKTFWLRKENWRWNLFIHFIEQIKKYYYNCCRLDLCNDAWLRKNTEKAHEKRFWYAFFKKIDEENVEELFDIKKNDLFYNAVTQQFRRSDVRETCNSERQIKLFFKLLMIKLKKL